MFHSTRIKLTVWYTFIIAIISVSFSVGMYKILTAELDRVERVQRTRIERGFSERSRFLVSLEGREESIRPFLLDPQLVRETKEHIGINLAAINLAILVFSAGGGYFLAGRTLKPIKEMVDEQGRFISDASHELRTPLTALKTEIEVNLRDKALTFNEAKRLLKSNLEEVESLQVLSDGLIKLTQYQKGGSPLTLGRVTLAELVDEAERKVTNLGKDKNVKILNNATDYNFVGNKLSLVELLVIFLDNAIKYSPKDSEVTVSSERTDGHILIHISDQGVGINNEDLPRLFDRFYRADESRTKSDTPGYGLGLSIAKQIVDRHHGVIRVKS